MARKQAVRDVFPPPEVRTKEYLDDGTSVYTTKRGRKYHYDANGFLLEIIEPTDKDQVLTALPPRFLPVTVTDVRDCALCAYDNLFSYKDGTDEKAIEFLELAIKRAERAIATIKANPVTERPRRK